MILTAEKALQFREDFKHIIGSILPTYNKGDYEVVSIVIVPTQLALAHNWTAQDLEDVGNDAHVYNPKFKEFFVMCVPKFLSNSNGWVEKQMKDRGHPPLYLLDRVLDELKIEFDRKVYLG